MWLKLLRLQVLCFATFQHWELCLYNDLTDVQPACFRIVSVLAVRQHRRRAQGHLQLHLRLRQGPKQRSIHQAPQQCRLQSLRRGGGTHCLHCHMFRKLFYFTRVLCIVVYKLDWVHLGLVFLDSVLRYLMSRHHSQDMPAAYCSSNAIVN